MAFENAQENFGPDYSPEFNFQKNELVQHSSFKFRGRVKEVLETKEGRMIIVTGPDGNEMRDIIDNWKKITD